MIIATSSGASAGAWWATSSEDDEPTLLDAVRDLAEQVGRADRVSAACHRDHRGGDLAEPVADVVRRERTADRDVPLVGGVAQRVQQRRYRAPARVRRSPARTSAARIRSPARRCRKRGPGRRGRATRRRRRSSRRCSSSTAPSTRSGRRAAAAVRPGPRPSRRRRGTGRRPAPSTRAARSSMVRPSGTGPRSVAVAGQLPGDDLELVAQQRRGSSPAGVGRGADRGAEHQGRLIGAASAAARLAAIRSGCTLEPGQAARRSGSRATTVRRARSRSVSHSACQAPSARSSTWSAAAR